MTPEVRTKIEQIRHGNVPGGYKHSAVGVVPADWDVHLISDHLSESYVLGNMGDVAKKITVKLWNRGVCEKKEIHQGSENTQYYRRQKGQFIYSKLDFLNCAFGIIPSELDGYESTQDLPAFDIREINPYYLLAQVTQRRFYERWGIMVANGGRKARRISPDDFLTFPIAFPNRYEQDKIAEILITQDKVIELEQQKIEEIKKVKKFFLSKMFPKKGQAVPEIRFKGFTDAWEQRKLGDCFDFLQNNTLSRAELSAETGAVLNVHNGDILIKYGEYLDVSSEQMAYIPDQEIVDKFKGSQLADGDIIMADTAEDETVGKCSEIAGLQGKTAISGLHTIPLRPAEKFAPGFLGYYMNSGAYHDQLLPLMQGIKVTSISKNAIKNTDISFPVDITEQVAIGQYFIRLDNLITLHQRKLEEEKQKKKALMQLLLTGIVRV